MKNIYYSVEDNPYFQVPEPKEGNVKLKSKIDREQVIQDSGSANFKLKVKKDHRPTSFNLSLYVSICPLTDFFKVFAKDVTGGEVEPPAEIEIKITDINDNNPIFKQSSYVAQVKEHAKIGKLNYNIGFTKY